MTAEKIEQQKAGFFAMIRADPDNDDNRLVFADWCEENGLAELAGMLRGGSRAYLENFAGRINPYESYAREYPEEEGTGPVSYGDLMYAAKACIDEEEDNSVIFLGFDIPDFIWEEQDEFWKHFEVMTGLSRSSDEQRLRFRCAC